MAVAISRKLSNSVEGALAGGGDPATSPLYVFGPFLKLIVVAGVAQVTFGATVWLAVFTVIMVSAMYRQVMRWVTDGSGGSGLSEEEFGSWAVKINAGITVIEYTLTFLVSMAALVTFIADRFMVLNDSVAGFQYRVFLAIALSLFTCWLVNLGPKVSARAFGPATAAVLLLLWGMVGATIYQTGFHLPTIDWQAFSLTQVQFLSAEGGIESSSYLNLTLGGYARILALMTGVEIFANLVAAYDGDRRARSRKAFGSLLMIMGTTAITMLIVGPAILAHSDPLNTHVSVFTQTMDYLLPPWMSYAGTLIGVAVLLSACAAAAQGVQNLALGLRYRHYVSARMGQRNRHDVAASPVWMMAAVSGACFLLFGTHEETYLALYAAGVFILLSMTGWAASKRLLRELRVAFSKVKFAMFMGTVIAALLTSFATAIIFEERFFAGAWSYLVLTPIFYAIFSYYRHHLGAPPSVEDRLGLILSGHAFMSQTVYRPTLARKPFTRLLVPLNGSALAEQSLPMIRSLARRYQARVELLMMGDHEDREEAEQQQYLASIGDLLVGEGVTIGCAVRSDASAAVVDTYAEEVRADLIVMTTGDDSVAGKLFAASLVHKVVKKTLVPTLVIRPSQHWRSRHSRFARILVALDGSEEAEAVVPYIRMLSHQFGGEVLLLSVPEGSESEAYGETIQRYLDDAATLLRQEGIAVSVFFTGSGPARTILAVAEEEKADLIMMASHGRGGVSRPTIHLGSVTEKVMKETPCPLLIVPLTRS